MRLTRPIKVLSLAILTALVPFAAAPALAASDPIYTPWHNNIAVGGYDVVSLFGGAPLKGEGEHFFDYKGASWYFATRENRNMFISDPARYTPEYGGYCAWALANDKLAKGDPLQFSLEDGKLYLNYNTRIKARWEADKAVYIQRADERWPVILN